MTLELHPADPPRLSIAEFGDALDALGFDPRDDASFAAAAPLLAGLARDRSFFGDLLIEELRTRAHGQEHHGSGYDAQVVMLGHGRGWFARANIWPAADDPLVRRNGRGRFFYGVPHDHNFSFLTVGYFGPGYWSDYYEHDDVELAGVPGEPVALRFVERSRLHEGRVLLYRAHRDIHDQHPPDAMSVSINIMEAGHGRAFRNQYRFDLDKGAIAAQLAHSPAEALLALLPTLGGDEGADLIAHFAASHPCDRIRFAAVAAQASAAPDLDARANVLARAAAAGNRTVAALARHRLAELENGRAWIEASMSG